MYHKSIFVLALAAAATTASGDAIRAGDTDITLTLASVSPARAISAYFNDTSTGDIFDRTVTAGKLNWSNGSSSFCVQILESIQVGVSKTFDAVEVEEVPEAPPGPGPMGTLRATLIRDLYARHYFDMVAASGSSARNESAAFAMIVWEITHQDSTATTAAGVLGDLDLTTGNARFSSSTSVNTLAQGWLAGLGGGTDDFLAFGQLLGLTDPTTQDFLIVVPGPAGMLAFAGLAGIRSRRRR
jgi:hypothetical protein